VGDTFASEIVGRGEANNLLTAGHKHGTSGAPEHFIECVIESERGVDRAWGFSCKIVHDAYCRIIQSDVG
jgi:hypothetical protein